MDRRKFMLAAGASLAVPARSQPALAKESTRTSSPGHKPHRPNVIVMICDDLGYGDLGCYGSRIATKNIDRLASTGVRFTHHSTPHPVCSASRAALLTGLYPTRVNSPGAFSPLDTDGISVGAKTLADQVSSAGYTAMAIGKWHLGQAASYWPTKRGFDAFYGVPYSVDMAPLPLMDGTTILEEDADRDLLTQRYTEKAVGFLRQKRQHPFFLYIAYSYPHIPLHASKRFQGRSKQGAYGDTMEEVDWSVGEIMKTLHEQGLEKDTLVIFTSDHGPWYEGSSGPLRGRKGDTYEGGVRVPMIASMPGAVPRGVVVDAVTSHMDIMPTLAGLCGAKLPEAALDGIDIWSAFTGGDVTQERVLLNFSGWDLQSARMGRWKLHLTRLNLPLYLPQPKEGRMNCMLRNPELYDLIEDPMESYDIAPRHPEIIATMKKAVEKQIAALPDAVQKAWAIAAQHLSGEWMPPDAPPMFVSTKPGTSVWKVGADADVVLQRFRALKN